MSEAAPALKYKAALSVAYGAGLRLSEVVSLKVSDIDSARMIVEQGKGRKDRNAMLSPTSRLIISPTRRSRTQTSSTKPFTTLAALNSERKRDLLGKQ